MHAWSIAIHMTLIYFHLNKKKQKFIYSEQRTVAAAATHCQSNFILLSSDPFTVVFHRHFFNFAIFIFIFRLSFIHFSVGYPLSQIKCDDSNILHFEFNSIHLMHSFIIFISISLCDHNRVHFRVNCQHSRWIF